MTSEECLSKMFQSAISVIGASKQKGEVKTFHIVFPNSHGVAFDIKTKVREDGGYEIQSCVIVV